MPTTIAPAVNLQAGVTTSVAPPSFADVGNAVVACVIFNQSSSVLTVTGSFGQSFLQPLTADLYPCPTIQSAPFVSPTTIVAANTYVGIAQAVFYFKGDDIPKNYPAPLVAFPGGSQTIVGGLSSTIATIVAPNNLGGLPHSIDLAPPAGTGNLILSNFSLIGNSNTFSITGDQSGTVYYTKSSPFTGLFTPSTVTVPLINNQDTTYTVALTGSGVSPVGAATFTQISGAPATPTPTFATLSTGRKTATGASTILAAPSTGANYLFELDWGIVSANGEFSLSTASLGVIADMLDNDTAAGITHPLAWGPLRVTDAVTSALVGGGGTLIAVIRYAPGP